MSRKDNNMRKLSFLGFNTREQIDDEDPNKVHLDDEMEKVFTPFNDKKKFDVTQLSDTPSATTLDIGGERYDENDYESLRKKSYPHTYTGRSMKRQDSKENNQPIKPTITVEDEDDDNDDDGDEGAEDEQENENNDVEEPLTSPTRSQTSTKNNDSDTLSPPDNTSLDVSENIQDDPKTSDRFYNTASESTNKHVKFNKGRSNKTSASETPVDEEDNRRRKERHYHHKSRKYSLQEYNRQNGTEGVRRISVQPEDAGLEEIDIDDLTSHRSDDPRGMRRHKVQQSSASSVVNINRKGGAELHHILPTSKFKKMYDHSPHEVFVQLDELIGSGDEREWKETARWIKYEEDVEEGADRWGRPHVASLSFHSLLNLRRCLETGVVLLDLEEKDLPAVAYRVVEQMVTDELIHEDDKPTIMRALLLRHRHVNVHSHGGFHFGSKRKFSSYSSLQSLRPDGSGSGGGGDEQNGMRRGNSFANPSQCNTLSPIIQNTTTRRIYSPTSTASQSINVNNDDKKPRIVPSSEINGNSYQLGETKIDIKEETYTSSQEDLKRSQNDSILKRIPEGAEATTVLVGAVDFLEQPTIAFIRLAEGIAMPSITEVPIPVRFLFILLGPKTADLDYHEVGRSIATLMSNEHFHSIAYKADDRKDLLSAINEFLDDSIVLPPGKWERQALLPFDELKAKSDMIRIRKKKALDAKYIKHQLLTTEEEKKLLAAGDDDGKKPPKNPLEKTHRLWGGLINDVKRRLPMYKSDIKDGLNTETLAATIFMYFAALSTAITFGGLAGAKTYNLIGISETLISASLVGIAFHALAGQPLVIIGTTGPLLLFDEALIQFCLANDFNFLTVRVFVGIWLAIIAVVVSAFEGSVYVRLFTRFTQEIFSALITLIYIFETVTKLISVYTRHPLLKEYIYKNVTETSIQAAAATTAFLNASSDDDDLMTTTLSQFDDENISNITSIAQLIVGANSTGDGDDGLLLPYDSKGPLNKPNTALFSTILTLGTFALAYYLKLFRNSHFLGRNARRALGDFGVPISIALFVALDFLIPEIYTEKLSVPEGISPSDTTQRGWLIPMTGVPGWLPFVAGVPALLVYILIFMETHISELIVDKPERGLKKGSGLHMDIVLLCFLNAICGFFGMPWHCAATVRSVTHVSAVTIMSRTHAPGDKPHITEVKEQRISGFIVSFLIGLSVTMAPLLRLIPMSVLFGVFLYMGVASMSGVQFFERLRLFLMPVKHHPQVPFVRRVPTWKMHIFTGVQVLALIMLWTVKSSQFSLAFPFFLIMMVPIRQKMEKLFTPLEMRALDGSQPNEQAEDEPDFYEQAPIPA